MSDKVPRIIWILWYQGYDLAPELVKKCIDSWVEKNPTWEVNILDSKTLPNYVDSQIPTERLNKLMLCHQSDLVRLELLKRYGGVWADATTLCMKPLDDWIDTCSGNSFFAFYKPGKDRELANWFIVSPKGGLIVSSWLARLVHFFGENDFHNKNYFRRKLIKYLSLLFNKNPTTTRYWMSWLTTKFLKIYPYHITHYIFNEMVRSDKNCGEIWDNTVKISADMPHLFKRNNMLGDINADLVKLIKETDSPMYKLTWKYDDRLHNENSIIHYLLERV